MIFTSLLLPMKTAGFILALIFGLNATAVGITTLLYALPLIVFKEMNYVAICKKTLPHLIRSGVNFSPLLNCPASPQFSPTAVCRNLVSLLKSKLLIIFRGNSSMSSKKSENATTT